MYLKFISLLIIHNILYLFECNVDLDIDASKTQKLIKLNEANFNSTLEASNALLLLFANNQNEEKTERIKYVMKTLAKELPKDFPQQVSFVFLNTTESPKIAEMYGITEFPSVYFIRFHLNIFNFIDFEINEESLMNFLNSKLVKKWVEVANMKHFMKLKTEAKLLLFYCGNVQKEMDESKASEGKNTSSTFELINSNVDQYEEVSLTWSGDKRIRDYVECIEGTTAIILFKNFDDGEEKVNLDFPVTDANLEEFLAMYASPIILDLTNDNLKVTIQQGVPTIIIFMNHKEEDRERHDLVERMYYMFNEEAKKLRREILFMKSTGDNKLASSLLKYYQIKDDYKVNKELFPLAIALHFFEANLKKYKWQPDLANSETLIEEQVSSFINGFHKGTLERFYYSEPKPDIEYLDNIYLAVGSTFLNLIDTEKQNVILEIHAKNSCDEVCIQIAKLLKRTAKKLQFFNETLRFVTIEENLNEIVEDHFKDLGLFVLTQGSDKKARLTGKMSVKTLIEFYNSHATDDRKIPVSKLTFDEEDVKEFEDEVKDKEDDKVGKKESDLANESGSNGQEPNNDEENKGVKTDF